MTVPPIRAVLVDVGAPPRTVELEPSALWLALGSLPIHFTSVALTRWGKRFGAVWCSLLPAGPPSRLVLAPMFRYREAIVEISGPIVITGAKVDDQALTLSLDEAATCIRLASGWPQLSNVPGGCMEGGRQPPGRTRRCKLVP